MKKWLLFFCSIHLLISSAESQSTDPSTTEAFGADCLICKKKEPLQKIEFSQPRLEFHACTVDKTAAETQKAWAEFKIAQTEKININQKTVGTNLKMPKSAITMARDLLLTEKYLKALDEIAQVKLVKNLMEDRRFREIMSSSEFTQKFKDGRFDQEIANSPYAKILEDPAYAVAKQKIIAELSNPQVVDAIKRLRRQLDPDNKPVTELVKLRLDLLDSKQRAGALEILRFFNKQNITSEKINEWQQHPPLLKTIPLMPASNSPFIDLYRETLRAEAENYLRTHPVTLEEARKSKPNATAAQVEGMNNLKPPNGKSAFDKYIFEKFKAAGPTKVSLNGEEREISAEQRATIAGVARTLWGEARSCESFGLPQFAAIGKIIAERTLAVQASLDERQKVMTQAAANESKDFMMLIFKQPVRTVQAIKGGLNDFGRPEAKALPAAVQVVSKDGQFSVWNSYVLSSYKTKMGEPNIPEMTLKIQGRQKQNDDLALNAVLCPEQQFAKENPDLWKRALNVATQVVLDPKGFAKKVKWVPESKDVLFYTHDLPLPFAKEVKINQIVDENGKLRSLRGEGHGACDHFRLFQPQTSGRY